MNVSQFTNVLVGAYGGTASAKNRPLSGAVPQQSRQAGYAGSKPSVTCRLVDVTHDQTIDRALDILAASLPADEVRPRALMKQQIQNGEEKLHVAENEESGVIGLAITRDVKIPNGQTWVLLNYLAIDEQKRCHGAGSQFLQQVERQLANDTAGMVLEIDPVSEADPMTARRLHFYERNGFSSHGYNYCTIDRDNGNAKEYTLMFRPSGDVMDEDIVPNLVESILAQNYNFPVEARQVVADSLPVASQTQRLSGVAEVADMRTSCSKPSASQLAPLSVGDYFKQVA